MNSYDFKGQVCVVTGGGQGIGLTVAQRLLSSGAEVAIWDRDASVLQAGLELCKPRQKVLGLTADISDLSSVESATRETISKFGKIDVLINNAAIVGPNAATWEYPPSDFRSVVDVGLIGTFYCCRTVVPHMIQNAYGRIVNVSSVAGKEGNPRAPAYSAMKAAVLALTKSLGKELAGHDIAVNAVTPAVAKTTMAMSQEASFLESIISKIPRGRMLELDEAASMICWIASRENSFTTAATFDLSGGRATY